MNFHKTIDSRVTTSVSCCKRTMEIRVQLRGVRLDRPMLDVHPKAGCRVHTHLYPRFMQSGIEMNSRRG